MAVTLRSVKGSALTSAEVDTNFRSYPQILASSGAAIANTGNTTENTLVTVTVPAGSMGANGFLRITTVWTTTNNGNTKTMRVKFNGTNFTAFSHTTSVGAQVLTMIRNRNSESSQVGAASSSYYSAGAAAHITSSHDTTGALNITITAQCVTSGSDTITLEGYTVELGYMA